MLRQKLKVKFSKGEIKSLLVSVITIGFVFSFNDWGVEAFDAGVGLINLVRAIIISTIALVTHIYIQKLVAKRYGQEIEYKIWSIQKLRTSFIYGGWGDIKKPIPLGVIIPLIVAFISNGEWLFLATAAFAFVGLKTRPGKRFPLITEYEEGKIAISGPLANVGLAIILKLLSFSINFDPLVQMNLFIALFHLIPVQDLSGIKVWFGGRVLYIFNLTLIIFIALLLLVLTPISAVIISLICAIILS